MTRLVAGSSLRVAMGSDVNTGSASVRCRTHCRTSDSRHVRTVCKATHAAGGSVACLPPGEPRVGKGLRGDGVGVGDVGLGPVSAPPPVVGAAGLDLTDVVTGRSQSEHNWATKSRGPFDQ